MLKPLKRMLAALLALTLLAASLGCAALAEDWRDMLRDAFGLTDDAGTEASQDKQAPGTTEAPQKQSEWELPITDAQQIVNYLDLYGELPENFITKKEARALGWDSSYNYVGDVAPGKSIGGDRFGNYEGQLPEKKGRQWFECDVDYGGRKRNAKRVLYSSDGLYYYTDDHYRTFTQMYPEE